MFLRFTQLSTKDPHVRFLPYIVNFCIVVSALTTMSNGNIYSSKKKQWTCYSYRHAVPTIQHAICDAYVPFNCSHHRIDHRKDGCVLKDVQFRCKCTRKCTEKNMHKMCMKANANRKAHTSTKTRMSKPMTRRQKGRVTVTTDSTSAKIQPWPPDAEKASTTKTPSSESDTIIIDPSFTDAIPSEGHSSTERTSTTVDVSDTDFGNRARSSTKRPRHPFDKRSTTSATEMPSVSSSTVGTSTLMIPIEEQNTLESVTDVPGTDYNNQETSTTYEITATETTTSSVVPETSTVQTTDFTTTKTTSIVSTTTSQRNTWRPHIPRGQSTSGSQSTNKRQHTSISTTTGTKKPMVFTVDETTTTTEESTSSTTTTLPTTVSTSATTVVPTTTTTATTTTITTTTSTSTVAPTTTGRSTMASTTTSTTTLVPTTTNIITVQPATTSTTTEPPILTLLPTTRPFPLPPPLPPETRPPPPETTIKSVEKPGTSSGTTSMAANSETGAIQAKNSSNTTLVYVLGSVAGGLLIIAIILAIIVFLLCRRMKRKEKTEQEKVKCLKRLQMSLNTPSSADDEFLVYETETKNDYRSKGLSSEMIKTKTSKKRFSGETTVDQADTDNSTEMFGPTSENKREKGGKRKSKGPLETAKAPTPKKKLSKGEYKKKVREQKPQVSTKQTLPVSIPPSHDDGEYVDIYSLDRAQTAVGRAHVAARAQPSTSSKS